MQSSTLANNTNEVQNNGQHSLSTQSSSINKTDISSSRSSWKLGQQDGHYYTEAFCTCLLHYLLSFIVIFWAHDSMFLYTTNNSDDALFSSSFTMERQSALQRNVEENAANEQRPQTQSFFIATLVLLYAVATFALRVLFPTSTLSSSSSSSSPSSSLSNAKTQAIVTKLYRKASLYEQTWLCNVTLFMGSIALYTGRPLITNAMCVAVSIDQLLWYVDLMVYLVSGSFPIGVAKYLTWKQTSWITKYTCTHHLWTIPVFFVATRGIHPLSYPLSIIVVLINVCLSRYFTPFFLTVEIEEEKEAIKVQETNDEGSTKKAMICLGCGGGGSAQTDVRRRSMKQTMQSRNHGNELQKSGDASLSNSANKHLLEISHKKYLNINLSYELWKDITFPILQINHDSPPVILYLFRLMWRWSFFNLLTCVFLYHMSELFFGESRIGGEH